MKFYYILFLAFCVASSKGIIIYNEEILVGLSFLAFMAFCFHFYGNTVQDSLDERASLIKTELENSHKVRDISLNKLLSEHRKIVELKKILPNVVTSVEQIISQISNSQAQNTHLNNIFQLQVQQKLDKLEISKGQFESDLQSSIQSTGLSPVLTKFFQIESQTR